MSSPKIVSVHALSSMWHLRALRDEERTKTEFACEVGIDDNGGAWLLVIAQTNFKGGSYTRVFSHWEKMDLPFVVPEEKRT